MARDWKSDERAVAKALGTWWGCVFRRTPSSGAWGKQGQSRMASKHSDAAGNFHGDIVAPPEAEFPFSVECKVYKDVEIYKALYAKSNIFEWWEQCVHDTPVGMYPMLVMRENHKKHLVALSWKTYTKLLTSPRLDKRLAPLPSLRLKFWHEGVYRTIVVFELAAFLEAASKVSVSRVLHA